MEPADVQQTFSNERSPTIWRIIPSLEFLIKRWETMASQPRYRDVSEAITDITKKGSGDLHSANDM